VRDFANETRDAMRDLDTARRNPREGDSFQRISLDNFVRNPSKHATNCLRVHDRDASGCILFWSHQFPWRPRGIALKVQKLGGGLFGARLLSSSLSPVGAMFHDPIQQSSFKADVFPGFFALDPFMLQNFRSLSKKLLVKRRFFEELRLICLR